MKYFSQLFFFDSKLLNYVDRVTFSANTIGTAGHVVTFMR